METFAGKFTYQFKLDNGQEARFDVDLDQPRADSRSAEGHAEWTRLTFHQCKNCPLDPRVHACCPVAIDIERMAERFSKILSYEKAEVQVLCRDRTYLKRCDVQSGIKSLWGLIMASGGCPILSQLKPMAFFHLPFSNVEETIFRTAGTFLLRQFFRYHSGQAPDLDLVGLNQLYEDLKIVNTHLLQRIRAASEKDANLNAICSLFALSVLVSKTIEEKLEQIQPLFAGD